MKSFIEYLNENYLPFCEFRELLNEDMEKCGQVHDPEEVNPDGTVDGDVDGMPGFVEIPHVEDGHSGIVTEDDVDDPYDSNGKIKITNPDLPENDPKRFIKVDKSEREKYRKDGYTVDGWRKSDKYYTSFSIQKTNSKLGKGVANFSLPPITTCAPDVPCKRKCYAVKSYLMYKSCAIAWDKNLDVLKNHPDWLSRDVNNFLQNTKSGKNVKLFRWQVSGDILNEEHLQQIKKIANDNPNVLFWLYTKKYDMISGQSSTPNLKIIVSAWLGWKKDQVDELHKKFPVAYFDDSLILKSKIEKLEKEIEDEKSEHGSKWVDDRRLQIENIKKELQEHMKLYPSDEESFICPCADDKARDIKEGDYYCATCRVHVARNNEEGKKEFRSEQHPCYELLPGESLKFREH